MDVEELGGWGRGGGRGLDWSGSECRQVNTE